MKITKTYSIEEEIYKLFSETCKKNNINKSSFIENQVKKYLRNEIGYEGGELYYPRNNEDYLVSILERDDTYFMLSDGTKIPQILFHQIFKKVEEIDPEKFFSYKKSPVEKMNDLVKVI